MIKKIESNRHVRSPPAFSLVGMRRASTVYSKRWSLVCEQALLLLRQSFSKLLRMADYDILTVWKNKERQLLCETSLRSESHEDIAKVLGGPQRSQSF